MALGVVCEKLAAIQLQKMKIETATNPKLKWEDRLEQRIAPPLGRQGNTISPRRWNISRNGPNAASPPFHSCAPILLDLRVSGKNERLSYLDGKNERLSYLDGKIKGRTLRLRAIVCFQ